MSLRISPALPFRFVREYDSATRTSSRDGAVIYYKVNGGGDPVKTNDIATSEPPVR